MGTIAAGVVFEVAFGFFAFQVIVRETTTQLKASKLYRITH
jgi:hypothetical protein